MLKIKRLKFTNYACPRMKAKLHLVLSISIFFLSFCGWSQDNYWKPIVTKSNNANNTRAQKLSVFNFEEHLFQEKLVEVTKEKTKQLIYFPNAGGDIIGFQVIETAVFHPTLSAK